MLYNSSQGANSGDVPGGAVKFATPIIANGKVYVGSRYAVSGFGLITSAVMLSPVPGTFATAQSVSLSDSTPGALIYYTTDGSTPTVNSALYSAPLAVSATTTIQAIAAAPGYSTSALASGSYVKSVVSTPVTAIVKLAPAPGNFTTEQSVSLSNSTPEALIHYTTDGSTPTANSTVYSAPLAVIETTTIKAIASAPGHSMSTLASGTYTVNAAVTVTGAPSKSGGGALDLWALALLAATWFRRGGLSRMMSRVAAMRPTTRARLLRPGS
jgi:hypothetical protein